MQNHSQSVEPNATTSSSVATVDGRSSTNRKPTCRLRVKTQSMAALLDVLVTISRLGATVVSVEARDNEIELTATGTEYVLRRLPKLLTELISVIEVECHSDSEDSAVVSA